MSQTIDKPEQISRSVPASRRQTPVARPRRVSLLDNAADELALNPPEPRVRRRAFFLSPIARAWIVAGLLIVFGLRIVLQLFSWQVDQNDYVKKEAAAQGLGYKTLSSPPQRGVIYDANGLVVASNYYVYNIFASPYGFGPNQSNKLAEKLYELLPNIPRDQIKKAVTSTDMDHNNNLVAREVDADTYEKVKAANLYGISLVSVPRRKYLDGFVSPLLGFVNFEVPGTGTYGLEQAFNKELTGTSGVSKAEFDPNNNPIVLSKVDVTPPVDGASLTLTIDSSIQFIVERELSKGLKEYDAERGMAIVADPQTGAILSWVSVPNYDPNNFFKYTEDPQYKDKQGNVTIFRDPLVSEVYEPGSTMKIMTAAIGIDTGVITPDSAADLPGCVVKYGRRICNFNSVGYPHQTVVKTLEKSSNVGAMWIAEKFGPDKYYEYIKNFGFGKQTGIEASGEAEGILKTKGNPEWQPLDFLENAFGQSIAVTPIQLVTAVSAVANGGKLMKPYVVSKITSADGKVKETTPTFVRQVIKPETAKITTDMLVSAVRQGETRLADVKGYRVAGKTGTATLYDSDLTIGSTIAYAPADNPRWIVYVRYDKPKKTPWGSNTAAPVVKTIIEQLFQKYNVPPTEPVK